MLYRLKGAFTFTILLKPPSPQDGGYCCLELAEEENTATQGGRLQD